MNHKPVLPYLYQQQRCPIFEARVALAQVGSLDNVDLVQWYSVTLSTHRMRPDCRQHGSMSEFLKSDHFACKCNHKPGFHQPDSEPQIYPHIQTHRGFRVLGERMLLSIC